MAVSFITGLLILALGYAYPAYDCYKTLELKNHPQVVEQMRFWCQYWILVAFLRVAECAVSWWLPMYGEAKLAIVVYLWHPRTRGAAHVYGGYLQPLLASHEADIDRRLLELTDAAASRLRAAADAARAGLLDAARRASSHAAAGRGGVRPAGHSDEYLIHSTT